MSKIEVVSTCTVKMASSQTTNGSISRVELTPWDLQFILLDPIQKGILFYKPPNQGQEFEKSFINHLKTTLSRALDFFPPLSGRLATTKNVDDDTSYFFVDCNNAGAQFTHSMARGVYASDILDPTHIPVIVRSFFSLNGVPNIEGGSKPLLGVQVTELVDGFFVACTINHSVMDGTSFWHFFNSWSEISRGSDKIQKLPVFDRSFLTNFSENRLVPVPPFDRNSYDNFPQPPLLERVFHFGKENISKLKNRANYEAKTDNKISSLQAVLAHLWRAVTRCRVNLNPDVEVSCTLFIGSRTRIPLPDTYFGNAIHKSVVTVKNGNLQSKGLGWVAMELNKNVALQTKEEVGVIVKDMMSNLKILKKDGVLVENGFLISSSPRHNVYGTDFGWGKPVAVRSGGAQKYDGKITLFPARESGGIDVEVCLARETLVAVENDGEFMEAVTYSMN